MYTSILVYKYTRILRWGEYDEDVRSVGDWQDTRRGDLIQEVLSMMKMQDTMIGEYDEDLRSM